MMRGDSGELGYGYLVAGGVETVPQVKNFLQERGIESDVNPDVYVREYLNFKIDDARELRDRAQTRAVQGGRRVFIVIAPTITNDAQNALLKVLEEPPADALFFLIVPSPTALLGTLRSRVQILSLDKKKAAAGRVDVESFLKAAPDKRIDMLKPLYEKTDDDERDVRGAVEFLAALESELSPKAKEARSGIEAVYRARKFLMDKGALLKPLLEQVALLTPRI